MINWRNIEKVGFPTDQHEKYIVTDGKDISTTDIYGTTRFKGDGNPKFTFEGWSGDDNTQEYNDCCSGKRVFEMIPTHWCPARELNLPSNTSWIKVSDELPERGVEIQLFNKLWINEDFNPLGIRFGFLDDVSGWVSAYWCNYHDSYHTRTSDEDDKTFEDFKAENQIPTHWKYNTPCNE